MPRDGLELLICFAVLSGVAMCICCTATCVWWRKRHAVVAKERATGDP